MSLKSAALWVFVSEAKGPELPSTLFWCWVCRGMDWGGPFDMIICNVWTRWVRTVVRIGIAEKALLAGDGPARGYQWEGGDRLRFVGRSTWTGRDELATHGAHRTGPTSVTTVAFLFFFVRLPFVVLE